MSDLTVKAIAVLIFPVLFVPVVFLFAIALVLAWMCIPFSTVIRDGWKIRFRWD